MLNTVPLLSVLAAGAASSVAAASVAAASVAAASVAAASVAAGAAVVVEAGVVVPPQPATDRITAEARSAEVILFFIVLSSKDFCSVSYGTFLIFPSRRL